MKRTKRASKKRPSNVSAVVAPEKRRRLLAIAEAEHRTLSQLVRIAIDEFLQHRDAA